MLLSRLMETSTFLTSTIIAGHGGLNRHVESVNIMDAPDIVNFLKKDELLLTTAYVMKDDPGQLETLVHNMHKVGCAGLAVKTKRFLNEIPQRVITEANRLAFPIIELSLDKTLGEISTQSLSYILEKKTEEMKYTLENYKRFSDIVLRGEGLNEIIHALSALLSKPVILFNQKLEPLTLSEHFKVSPYNKLIPYLTDIIPSYPFQSPVFQPLCLFNPIEFRGQSISAYPIESYQLHGILVVFGQSVNEQNPSYLAIEQAANVIRFEMLKMQAVKERSRRAKNEFFADLVDERFSTEQEIIHRGHRYGLIENKSLFSVIAKRDIQSSSSTWPSDTSQEMKLSDLDHLYDFLKIELRKQGMEGIRFIKNDVVVLLLPISEKFTRLKESLQKISDNALRRHDIKLSFGVGKPVERLLDIPLTFSEAAEALKLGYNCKKERFVEFFNARELVDLFRLIGAKDLLVFYKDTLSFFDHLEEKERAELLQTLKVYFDEQCRIGDTAKQLFVHRNTVYNRLEKCSQLLGHDLRSANEILRLRIAFLIEPLLQRYE